MICYTPSCNVGHAKRSLDWLEWPGPAWFLIGPHAQPVWFYCKIEIKIKT